VSEAAPDASIADAKVAPRRASWRAALVRRISRIRPDRVIPAHLGWIVGCWVLTATLVGILLVPGLTDVVTAESAGAAPAFGRFAAPLPFRVLVAITAAVLTAVHLVALRLRRELSTTRRAVVDEIVLAAALAFPTLALLADRAWFAAAGALVLLVLAEIAAHLPALGESPGSDAFRATLAGSPWLVLLVVQPAVPQDGGGSWAWVALFGFAAALAAFGSYYGIARAAESRTRALRFLFRRDLHPALVLGIVVIAAAIVVLRLTVARDLFPDPDPALWSPGTKPPLSWVHAAVVAGMVAVIALRSSRRPLLRSGERRITAALAAAGNADLVVSVGVILLGMLVAAASGAVYLPDGWLVATPALKVAGVVAIALVALLPAFRGTAARWLALISAAYLIPVTVNGVLTGAGVDLPPGVAGFPASPVQVTVVLVGVALGIAIVRAVAAPLLTADRRSSGVVVRLAVVPLVAVHAGWLLPAAWSDLGRVLLAVGVVLGLLFFLPPVAADRRRRTLDLLTASAAQVLALVVVVLALPSLFDGDTFVVLGLFWLSVAVIAALVVETVDRAVDRAAESP
jgi:hypothetical protein